MFQIRGGMLYGAGDPTYLWWLLNGKTLEKEEPVWCSILGQYEVFCS